jgi:hydrogenase maturation protease
MRPQILVAGIGNIFLGDDAFGVEVARQLSRLALPDACQVVDYGIRSFDLAMALLGEYDIVIMVDAAPRGEAPGTLFVIEPNLPQSSAGAMVLPAPVAIETHGMGPEKVLSLAASMGGVLPRVLLVGCEPSPLLDESDILAGLSPPVRAAVDEAIVVIGLLVQRLLAEWALEQEPGPPASDSPGSTTN